MFHPMHKYLRPVNGGRFRLDTFTVSESDVRNAKLSSILNGRGREYQDFLPVEYVRLVDTSKNQVVMSDTQMEQRTNMDLYQHANGHVLIGGLGIGMILLAIQDKPEVTKITVIEKYGEVYAMVAPQLPLNEKVEIVIADVLEYEPPKGVKYDTVYMDIWNDICMDNWEEYKALNRKFMYRLNKDNPNRWCSAWRKYDVQKMVREYARERTRDKEITV